MWKKLLIVSLIFAISVVILIMLSLYSFQRFDAFVRYTEATEKHHLLLSELSLLRIRLTEMENNQRAFLLFEDSSLLNNYRMSEIQVKQVFSSLHQRTKNQPDQQRKLGSLNLLIKSR